jgi:hypothetical protein
MGGNNKGESMKKVIVGLICAASLLAAGCSSDMTIDGKVYKPYGLLNEDDVKVAGIQYQPCWGNIVWGAVLVETIVGPIYFFGFDMFEPVGKKPLVP